MRSERTKIQLLSLLNQNGSDTKSYKDKENLPILASRYGCDYAYPALKLFGVNGYELQKHGYYHVQKNGLWGLVHDKKGVVLNCEYEDIDFVYGNMAMFIVPIKKDGKWGCKWFYPEFEGLPCIYDNIFLDKEHFPYSIGCTKDGEEGLYNCAECRWELPVEYQSLRLTGNYKARYPVLIAQKNGKFGLIKSNDNSTVLPIEYDRIFKDHHIYYAEKDGQTIALSKEDFPMIYTEED